MTNPDNIDTPPSAEQINEIATKIERAVRARQAGDTHTAAHLLADLVKTPDEAFALMLTLARTAAYPAVLARKALIASGRTVQDILPLKNNLSEPEYTAMRLVAMLAKNDEVKLREAMNLAGETILANDPAFTQRVITTLVDVLAQGGPNIRPITNPFSEN